VPRWSILGAVIASVAASLVQVAGLTLAVAGRRLLDGKLGRNALILGALAAAVAVWGSRLEHEVELGHFVLGAAATALVWSLVWLACVRDTGLLRRG
jgi:hypothetical protein